MFVFFCRVPGGLTGEAGGRIEVSKRAGGRRACRTAFVPGHTANESAGGVQWQSEHESEKEGFDVCLSMNGGGGMCGVGLAATATIGQRIERKSPGF